MAFVRILATLLRDKKLGKRVVPIVPDEARTFGMEGMFRQLGIYSSVGQLYEPEDSDELAAYKESKSGQVLEEGINEAGAFAAWIAAATSYSTHQYTLLPFYIYYSMFGFQRVGDLAWAAGDLQAKGFLLGGTAGRTTLNGEGLQHQDGHSHVLAATVPNCISYDPAYAFELAVIIRRGLEHMYVEQAPVYYYLTLMNEAYQHPAMPEGVEADIIKGMYLLETLGERRHPRSGFWAVARCCRKRAVPRRVWWTTLVFRCRFTVLPVTPSWLVTCRIISVMYCWTVRMYRSPATSVIC